MTRTVLLGVVLVIAAFIVFDVVPACGFIAVVAVCGWIGRRYPESDEDDASFATANLDRVPDALTRPEPRGDLFPWYRRVLGARIPEVDEPPVRTYRS